ncbi:MAG TPA: hypothetical protein VN494_00075 [Patescibacteria group bacterium]|nr:hypothetical protein [Patescibacteria group bacterium]
MRFRPTRLTLNLPAILLVAALGLAGCGNWPLEPRNVRHPIGNSGGEFQQYGGAPYFHTGIDIMDDTPAPDGPFVRTKNSGTATLSLPGAGSLYNGLTVSLGDATNSSQKYWHLDFNSIEQAVRDADTDGTVLPARSRVAQLVDWTACDYHHLHFETCDDTGCVEPVLSLRPRSDTNSPVIVDVTFTDNGSTTIFPPAFPDTVVRGQVDIVARAYDRQFVTASQNHKTGMLKIRYQVTSLPGGAVVKTGSTIDFSRIPPDNKTTVLFRNAAPFDSSSAYCAGENYYYVATNVDDADPAHFDETFSWDTTVHPNGRYWVEVTASDASSNTFSLTKQVRIDN